MPQRVIIEPFRIEATGVRSEGFEPAPTTLLAKALVEGWRIVRSSSVMVEGLSTLYVTFILEKQEEKATKPYKGF